MIITRAIGIIRLGWKLPEACSERLPCCDCCKHPSRFLPSHRGEAENIVGVSFDLLIVWGLILFLAEEHEGDLAKIFLPKVSDQDYCFTVESEAP